jgi:hypothetical protein
MERMARNLDDLGMIVRRLTDEQKGRGVRAVYERLAVTVIGRRDAGAGSNTRSMI